MWWISWEAAMTQSRRPPTTRLSFVLTYLELTEAYQRLSFSLCTYLPAFIRNDVRVEDGVRLGSATFFVQPLR